METTKPWECQGCGFECHDVEAFLDLIGRETNADGKKGQK
jgi:hypothetical protein